MRRAASRPEGVERVTGAETRQITEWFAAGSLARRDRPAVGQDARDDPLPVRAVRHAERRPVADDGSVHARAGARAGGLLPEHEATAAAEAPARGPATQAACLGASGTSPARDPSGAPQPPRLRRRASPPPPAPQVPDSWFTDPLPPLPDDDD